MTASDQTAPFGTDDTGRPRAPYGLTSDGRPKLAPGRGKGFGSITKRGKRYQARYPAPDGTRPTASFERKALAELWLSEQRISIERGEWKSTAIKAEEQAAAHRAEQQAAYTLNEWADEWLTRLERNGRTPKTVQTHRYRLSRHIRPDLGARSLQSVTDSDVTAWHDALAGSAGAGVSHGVYMTLRAMLNEAVAAGRITANPARVPGASKHRPKGGASTAERVATPAQVAALADAMPEHLRIAVHLAAWCQLRIGEVLELRRNDLDLKNARLNVRRQVQWIAGKGAIVTPPKSEAGMRSISIPSSLIPALREHIVQFAGPGHQGLVVAHPQRREGHVHHNSFRAAFNRARDGVEGLEGFVFHALRHTGLTELARQGATPAELMYRGGHSSLEVAMRYQHATHERDRSLAERLSAEVLTTAPSAAVEQLYEVEEATGTG